MHEKFPSLICVIVVYRFFPSPAALLHFLVYAAEHADPDANADVNEDASVDDGAANHQEEESTSKDPNHAIVDEPGKHAIVDEPGSTTPPPPMDDDDDDEAAATMCLVRPEDLEFVSERTYFIMQHYIPSTKITDGCSKRGMVCKVCNGTNGIGSQSYATTPKSLSSSQCYFVQHAKKCFPSNQMAHLSNVDPKPKSSAGGRVQFYRRVFDRWHGKMVDTITITTTSASSQAHAEAYVSEPSTKSSSAKKRLVNPKINTASPASAAVAAATDPSSTKSSSCSVKNRRGRPKKNTSPRLASAAAAVPSSSSSSVANSRHVRATVASRTAAVAHVDNGSSSVPPPPQQEGPMLLLEKDPNGRFIEELAFLFHDPKEKSHEAPNEEVVNSTDLEPLPPPPPSPTEFPKDSLVVWQYIEDQRVLLADFTNVVDETNLPHADMDFLASSLERDDITVISQNLLDPKKLDKDLWNFNVRTTIRVQDYGCE
jgi:hypothetical protein